MTIDVTKHKPLTLEAARAALEASKDQPRPLVLAQFPTPAGNGTCAGMVELRDMGQGYHPLATHWRNTDLGGRNWGHYHAADQLAEAVKDFNERVQRGY